MLHGTANLLEDNLRFQVTPVSDVVDHSSWEVDNAARVLVIHLLFQNEIDFSPLLIRILFIIGR